jgi:two-component system chemotaxis response regulator CheB
VARARRIVLCDRSPGRAQALTRFLESDPEIEVAAAFGDFEAMLPTLGELAPDLIALDLGAVGPDVPGAIAQVRRAGPIPLLIVAAEAGGDEDRVAAALGAGALEAIEAKKLDVADAEGVWATALRSRIKRLASHHSARERAAAPAAPRRRPGASYRAIGIGASVGGPPALAAVLGALPVDFPIPVLVVQHVASGFGESLSRWLDETVALPVALAAQGESLRPGAWLAPDGHHVRVSEAMELSLDGSTERGAHRPSLDVLFESMAKSLGAEAVGVVLTGMGKDGAEGIRAIREAGGLTIAQDEKSSAVFGMPAAAAKAGAELVVPLEDLAPRLASLRTPSAAR